MIKVVSIAAVSLLLAGCTSANRETDDEQLVWEALEQSTTFAAVKRHSLHPSYMLEESTAAFVTVAIGENMPDRFVRLHTLRVHRNGTVERCVFSEDGEEYWARD